jgi:hypothetical protein
MRANTHYHDIVSAVRQRDGWIIGCLCGWRGLIYHVHPRWSQAVRRAALAPDASEDR